VNYDISPEPDEAERAAILEALAAEKAERDAASPWADTVLPQHDAEDGEQA